MRLSVTEKKTPTLHSLLLPNLLFRCLFYNNLDRFPCRMCASGKGREGSGGERGVSDKQSPMPFPHSLLLLLLVLPSPRSAHPGEREIERLYSLLPFHLCIIVIFSSLAALLCSTPSPPSLPVLLLLLPLPSHPFSSVV